MKILIGGVPFGRDNVGDEAILERVVVIVRSSCPNAEILVSTDEQKATADKLAVRTVPLFGFDPPGYDHAEMTATIREVDAFIWAGATGLSDYPEVSLRLLQTAIDFGKKTAVLCTGMNSELNPYLYRLSHGARHSLYSLIKKLSFGYLDPIASYNETKEARVSRSMRLGLDSTGLIILRDSQSAQVVETIAGPLSQGIHIGADPAIEITPKPLHECRLLPDVLKACEAKRPKIGLCISSQSPVTQLSELAAVFDQLIDSHDFQIVGIPMNPITDTKIMSEFAATLEQPHKMCVAEGRYEPDEIAGLAAEMDVIISSRLHLLILASISLTPFIGIDRGSKISNFTTQFGLSSVGSVDALDTSKLLTEIVRLIEERTEFESRAKQVREEMMARLGSAKALLRQYLNDPSRA